MHVTESTGLDWIGTMIMDLHCHTLNRERKQKQTCRMQVSGTVR